MLGAGRNDVCVVTVSGRIRRVTCWVPLEKAQSFREVQGPVQRRLGLATVHVDTVGRGVRAALRDREAGEAEQVLAELPGLARAARRRYAAGAAAGAAATPAAASRPGS
jgi:putative membrane protein